MYLKKFIVHWSIGKTDRRRQGGAEGRSDHKNAPKTEPLKSTEHTKIYVPPVYNQLIMSVVELTNSETSDSLYGLYIMGRLFGPRVVIQCIV